MKCKPNEITGPNSTLVLDSATKPGYDAFAARVQDMYPEYLTDPNIYVCPSESDPPTLFNPKSNESMMGVYCNSADTGISGADECYFYTGWLMAFEDENLPITVLSALLAAAGDTDMQTMISTGKIQASTKISAQTAAALLFLQMPDSQRACRRTSRMRSPRRSRRGSPTRRF